MRKKNFKGRCEKRRIEKCSEVCRTYDPIQYAYWGTQLEALVREEFTKRTGIEVQRVNQILQSQHYPFMLANLDGQCVHPKYGICGVEAKIASAYKTGEWEDTIPDEYQLQIQHYMAVTG